MNRLRLLAAALLAVPLVNACDEAIPPTPMGTIDGQVVIEGEPQVGVTVKLDNGATATTSSTGSFSFEDVEAGTYTITISGFAEDGSFDRTSQPATIANDGQQVSVNFNGAWIRTSAVMGAVTVEGTGLEGVVVKLTGMSEAETTTSVTGAYSFTGLRAGVYTVEISGFDEEDIGFSATSSVAEVAVGESGVLDFQAAYLRASAIMGQVSVEGEGLAGVTVSLQGVDRSLEVGTNGGGQFSFTELRKGSYSIAISGYDTDKYGFDVTSQTITVAYGETFPVDFDGIDLRTAAVSGRVTIEGTGLESVTVSLTGEGAQLSMVTDAAGQWTFTELHAGSYSIGISGFDTDEYGFDETSASVTVALKETATVEFDGIKLRTAAISGQVSIEGDPLAGVTITVNGKGEEHVATTNAAGNYSIDRLHAGDYTVAISGFDTDEYDFEPTVQSVSVGLRETADIGFDGIMLRTVEIMGAVTTDGEPLGGVTVTISGGRADEEVTAVTDMEGGYSVDRLHAGDYTVAVSGFDTDEYEFEPASQSIMVELREMADVDFPGVKLRTVEIFGTVAAEGEPLHDVTVTVSGGRADETVTTTTDAAGGYSVERLHAGEYTVAISGYDEEEFEFDPASQSVTVELREMREVLFDNGIPLRTASISGRVTMGDDPVDDITVTLSGEHEAEMETNSNGQYNFPGLPAGDYTLEISGFDAEEYEYTPESMDITLMLDEGRIANFEGRSLRTVVITGAVTAEGEMIAGANAQLWRVISLTEIVPVIGGARTTDENGEYTFDGLLDDWYAVLLTGYDDEYDFPKIVVGGQEYVAWTGYVATDSTAMVDFTGTIIRTAMIGGMVTADGKALMDVDVMIEGMHAPDDNMAMTDADGMYMFDGLRKGDYTISITNPDMEMYDFPTTASDINVAVGQVQDDVSFDGSILRGASISGQVNAEGHALGGVAVMLSGDDDGETTTDANGEYNFPTLAGGDYTVSITNPDPDMYVFAVAEKDVDGLGSDEARIVDFSGEYVHEASVSGTLFLDEVDKNGEMDDGEPVFEGPAATMAVLILKNEDGDMWSDTATAEGSYSFMGLKAGMYTLMHDAASDPGLDAAGYAFAGDTAGVMVELTGTSDEMVDLPYAITKQTMNIGAVMGNRIVTTTTGVAGVHYDVYPNLAAAQSGSDLLGSGVTPRSGMAAVTFDRADDYGPGGKGTPTDGVVVVVPDTAKSKLHADLRMRDGQYYEAVFDLTERTSDAMSAVTVYNTASQFRWGVMRAARAVGGGPLEGWTATVIGGDSLYSDTTAWNGYAMVAEDSIPYASIPRTYTVLLDIVQPADTSGEMWVSSGPLSYTHTGLDLPGASGDAGTIEISWTTQSLYLAFYREVDGTPGFTDDWVGGGDVPLDHRPVGSHLGSRYSNYVSWEFNHPFGRYEVFEWDHDGNPRTEDVGADDAAEWVADEDGNYWIVRFPMIPTNAEFEINLMDIGTGKILYSGPKRINAFGSDLTTKVTHASGVFNTFGAGGGGHPEMWLCGESPDITPDNAHEECITHGYQWKNAEVSGAFWPRARRHLDYEEFARLKASMTVTLEGVSPTATSGGDTITMKGYDWSEVNDGVYILSTTETAKYDLDHAVYWDGDVERIDSLYLDTLYAFYQERTDAERYGEFESEITFEVTELDPVLNTDATLAALTYDDGGGEDTVPGFTRYDRDGSEYDITVARDVDSVAIAATMNDSLAPRPRGTGKMAMGRVGKTTTFQVTGTAEDGKTTATYTINILRTEDRIKVRTPISRFDTLVVDAIEAEEGDSIELLLSLWTEPTADVTVTYHLEGKDSAFTFTAANYDTEQVYWRMMAEDYDGEDLVRVDTLEVSSTDDDHDDFTVMIDVRSADNDVKHFAGPTEISAIEGVEATNKDFQSPVVTTLSTAPTDDVDLLITATDGGSTSATSAKLVVSKWDEGVSFGVVGDEDGNDFEVSVAASGGGYAEVDYPAISVDWVDSTDHKLVVMTQAANIVPDTNRVYSTKVVLWRANAVDSRGNFILDEAVVFDTADVDCPEEWTCMFGNDDKNGRLDRGKPTLTFNVTAPDTARAGQYTVTFAGTEDDEDNGNGYFIGEDLVEYAIRFTVLDIEK